MDASEILRLLNKEREARGIMPLSADGRLKNVAQDKAEDMSGNGYFSHQSPGGATFSQLLRGSGYSFEKAAENIAFNSDPSAIVSEWMSSAVHRANILDPAFNATGIGLSAGMYQGRQVVFAVQLFAKAQSQKIAVIPEAAARAAPEIIQDPLPAPKAQPIQTKQKASEPVVTAAQAVESAESCERDQATDQNCLPVLDIPAIATMETIVSQPLPPQIAKADHPSGILIAPAFLAVAAMASLRIKRPLPKPARPK